jgi:uncharacterized coiled-coil DUF342 family protein
MDHYVAYMQSEIREMRQERELLQAKVAQLEATVQRVREVHDDYLNRARLLTAHGIRHDIDATFAAWQLGRALGDTDE